MKKTIFSLFLMSLSMEGAYAGGMGEALVSQDYFVPFISGEAAATWNTTKSATVFGSAPSTTQNPWGGRGAFGVVHVTPSHFGFSSEIGWGYYGRTTSSVMGISPSGALAISNNSYLNGFDILAGLTYDFAPCRVYLKGGAMLENRYIKGVSQFTNTVGSKTYISTNNIQTTTTNVFPEVKVGGIYNLNDHLGLSLAYMHVFGNENFAAQVSGALTNPQALAGISSVVSAQNPSLNSVMFGLVYNFG